MLDDSGVNNNFGRDFQTNCEEFDCGSVMALELPAEAQIQEQCV
jgi:hypothetical protein